MPRSRSEFVTVSDAVRFLHAQLLCALDDALAASAERPGARTAAARRPAAAPPRPRSRSRSVGAERTSRSATGSPFALRRLKTAIRPPIRPSTSSRPVRVGFTSTSWMRRFEPESSVAGNDERRGRGEIAGDVERERRDPLCRPDADLHARARQAQAERAQQPLQCGRGKASARPPWSDRPRPAAPRAGRADFSCALATGSSYRIGCNRAPSIVTGGRPSLVSTRAPICRSGSSTRHRARRERLVADELEASLLAGQDPAQQPEHGAGVAAVDRGGRRE